MLNAKIVIDDVEYEIIITKINDLGYNKEIYCEDTLLNSPTYFELVNAYTIVDDNGILITGFEDKILKWRQLKFRIPFNHNVT